MTTTLAQLHTQRKERLARFAQAAWRATQPEPQPVKPAPAIDPEQEAQAWRERQLWFWMVKEPQFTLNVVQSGKLVRSIQRETADAFCISVMQLLGDGRSPKVALPRFAAIYLTRTMLPHWSLAEIGRRFGGRDHTTILHSYTRAVEMIAEDGEFARNVEAIRELVQ